MSDLTSVDLKRSHVEAIASADTFRTHGISAREARGYLKTREGIAYLTRLNEAAPDLSIDKLRERAIDQITSGRELPRMEMLDEPLVKIVPKGQQPSPFSPYWAKEADLDAAIRQGRNLSHHFARQFDPQGVL